MQSVLYVIKVLQGDAKCDSSSRPLVISLHRGQPARSVSSSRKTWKFVKLAARGDVGSAAIRLVCVQFVGSGVAHSS